MLCTICNISYLFEYTFYINVYWHHSTALFSFLSFQSLSPIFLFTFFVDCFSASFFSHFFCLTCSSRIWDGPHPHIYQTKLIVSITTSYQASTDQQRCGNVLWIEFLKLPLFCEEHNSLHSAPLSQSLRG